MDVLHDDPAVRVDEHALLHAAIQDVAGRVHEWHQQTEEAHRTLEDALVKVEEFRRRALSARDTIASVQEYERRLIQALESVQQAHEALAQAPTSVPRTRSPQPSGPPARSSRRPAARRPSTWSRPAG